MTTLTEEAKRTLTNVKDRLDSAFERLRTDPHGKGEPPLRLLFGGPTVDVEETADVIFVRAELPGLKPGDFSIEVTANSVIVRGEKREESDERGEGFYRQERKYGSFMRRVELPSAVDPAAATAAFKDGVLRLMLPKAESSKAHRVSVVVEGS